MYETRGFGDTDRPRFLPSQSVRTLQEMHKKEQNPKAAARLLAYVMRKQGMSIR